MAARPRTEPDAARPTPRHLAAEGDASRWIATGFDWRLATVAVLVAIDWASVFAALALMWWVRNTWLRALIPALGPLPPFTTTLGDLYLLAPWTVAFAAAGLYTRRLLFWDEMRQVVRGCTLAALFAAFLSFAVRPAEELSRLVIAGTWLLSLCLVPVLRYNAKRALVAAGWWGKRVLIVGAGTTGTHVLERIRAHTALGYQPIAFVDDDAEKIGRTHAGLPVLGPLRLIPDLVRGLAVKDIVLAMPRLPRERLLHVLTLCESYAESIRVIPDMFGAATVGIDTEDLDGLLLLRMRSNLAQPWNLALKRGFDLVVGTTAALALLPVLLLAALAIRLDSPGPTLFVEDRLGRGWRRFRCIKFRTMHVDGERRLHEHLAGNLLAQAEWDQYAKLKSTDPRVTRVGRVLRRLSLDEVPQLANVLRGEMSLVGPRPYLPRELERMGDFAETILKASPGMTGLWQVSGRNQLAFDQRLRLDEYYVRNWSLWMDSVVLMRTIGEVVRSRGAY